MWRPFGCCHYITGVQRDLKTCHTSAAATELIISYSSQKNIFHVICCYIPAYYCTVFYGDGCQCQFRLHHLLFFVGLVAVKMTIFRCKNYIFFFIFTLKLDCGHSLEQPFSLYLKHPMPCTVILTAIKTIFK